MVWVKRGLSLVVIVWLAYAGAMYWLMSGPPMKFAAVAAKLPPPLMMALPFPPMWKSARAGKLAPGDTAPDFELEKADRSGKVRLSSFRGSRPVVLVFGSYT